jgi:hypothetical protein
LLDNITEDKGKEVTCHHNKLRKMIQEPIHTCEDTECTQGEIKQTIESFNGKKAPGIMGLQVEFS